MGSEMCIRDRHIPVFLSVVVADPEHPFWHVLSLFDQANLTFVTGGGVLSLSDELVENIRTVIPVVKGMSRRSFYRVHRAVKKTSKEELKLLIEGLAADGKFGKKGSTISSKLCWLIDDIARRSSTEEERKNLTHKTFRLLAFFTRKE